MTATGAKYQILPPLSDEEYEALKADIAARGVQVPVEYDEQGNVLDGHHRLRACQELGISDFPSIVRRFGSEEEKVEHILALNLARRHLTREQRRDVVVKLYQQGWSTRRIAKWVGVTHPTVLADLKAGGKNLPPALADLQAGGKNLPPATVTGADGKQYPASRPASVFARTPRERVLATRALAALNDGALQAVEEGRTTVREAYRQVTAMQKLQRIEEALQSGRELSDLEILEQAGISIQPYDVWQFQNCDDRFGFDYPGRIPGQLVAHCLYFFTQRGDLVVDPMAGSGTTLDVCRLMGRRCLAYDVRPARPDILRHDLRNGWPPGTEDAVLVFWDPPYYRKKDAEYSEESVSRLDRDAYLDWFAGAFTSLFRTVRPGAILAFLMSDWDSEGVERPEEQKDIFVWEYAVRIEQAGWRIRRCIQCPLPAQQVPPYLVDRFRQMRRLARLNRSLLIAVREA